MKQYTCIGVFCVLALVCASAAAAQQGGQGQFGYGFTGPQGAGQFGYGFTGPSMTVTVAQAQTYSHKSPVILQGTITHAIGRDMYVFRDSTGEILLKIGPKEWQYFGSTINPTDTIEISGEVHRKHWQPEVHARIMKKMPQN